MQALLMLLSSVGLVAVVLVNALYMTKINGNRMRKTIPRQLKRYPFLLIPQTKVWLIWIVMYALLGYGMFVDAQFWPKNFHFYWIVSCLFNVGWTAAWLGDWMKLACGLQWGLFVSLASMIHQMDQFDRELWNSVGEAGMQGNFNTTWSGLISCNGLVLYATWSFMLAVFNSIIVVVYEGSVGDDRKYDNDRDEWISNVVLGFFIVGQVIWSVYLLIRGSERMRYYLASSPTLAWVFIHIFLKRNNMLNARMRKGVLATILLSGISTFMQVFKLMEHFLGTN